MTYYEFSNVKKKCIYKWYYMGRGTPIDYGVIFTLLMLIRILEYPDCMSAEV